jgi:hypothetical protein
MRGQIVNVVIKINDSEWKELTTKLVGVKDTIVKKAAQKAQSFWISEAGRRLDTSRWRYIEAIQFKPHYSGYKVFLQHTDRKVNTFLNRLENGMNGTQIDMKPAILAKAAAKGKSYAIVPLWKEHGGKPIEFRTVSVNSPPDSWLWPNSSSMVFSGVQIKEAVVRELSNSILEAIIEETMQEL